MVFYALERQAVKRAVSVKNGVFGGSEKQVRLFWLVKGSDHCYTKNMIKFIETINLGVLNMSNNQPSLSSANINFRTDDEQSSRLNDVRKRAKRCVCKYCGGELSLRKITYAAYDEAKIEVYCEHCGRIEYGVEPEIYKLAAYYIDALRYDHYPNLDDSEQKRRMNIAVISDILSWGFKNTKLLDADGFTIDVAVDEDMLGEAITISDTELDALAKE